MLLKADFSNESIEYLVAAILLHDLGMFISQAGLNNLIFGKQKIICNLIYSIKHGANCGAITIAKQKDTMIRVCLKSLEIINL